ncbi:MAG: hypothetical protein M1839_002748 [Geoglossum umbratile]|nr:MAG: hypothetical protein M1839_002748 [Geoglossum umbratile]
MPSPLPQGDIFRYLPDHRILVCVPCGYVVQPQSITSHLQKKEHHDLSLKDRRALRTYALSHDLTKLEDVKVPDAGAMPLPGLRLMNGYACGFCSYLTTNVYSLREHGRRKHDKRRHDGVYWREVKLQTFSRGNQVRYFIVSNTDSTVPDNNTVGEASKSHVPSVDAGLGITEKLYSANSTGVASVAGAEVVGGPDPPGQGSLRAGPTNGFEVPPNPSVMDARDSESDVLTFRPSLEEFRDFPKFLTEALAASRAGPGPHVGVCVVKVPQGGLNSSAPVGIARSRNSRCLQYFEQTSKVLDPNNSGVFRINHTTKGPTTITQWQKLVDGAMQEHGNTVGDDRMNDLFSQESLKAVYVSNTAAKSISSLFSMDPIGLSELPGNQLQHLDIPGMSSDYIYLGAPGSLFTMHLEDYNVHSFNYLRSGEPKRWVVVNPSSRTKFEDLIKATFPAIPATCSQFMRHQNLYMSPSFLSQHSIGFAEITQTPGDMLVLFPFAYHQGYNMGENLALASNYALESEEPLYERDYIPCGSECCPGLVPLLLKFPLKLQKTKEFEVVMPGSKRKVCSGRDGADSTAPRKRGRPKKTKVKPEENGDAATTIPKYNRPKRGKTPKADNRGALIVPNTPPAPNLSAAQKHRKLPKAKAPETDGGTPPKRGRPKRVKVPHMDGEDFPAPPGTPTEADIGPTPTPPKRGRPKKVKVPEMAAASMPDAATTTSSGFAAPKTPNRPDNLAAPHALAESNELTTPSGPSGPSALKPPIMSDESAAHRHDSPEKARVLEINSGVVSAAPDATSTTLNDFAVPNITVTPSELIAISEPTRPGGLMEPNEPAAVDEPIVANTPIKSNEVIKLAARRAPTVRKRGRPKKVKSSETNGVGIPVVRKRGRPPKAEVISSVEQGDIPAALKQDS